ncbi:hypothetical protein LTS08_002468 [Lithohypha guttulata]|nr:hypothetical protein LTS08_002468 [Lithohypha guttulata]
MKTKAELQQHKNKNSLSTSAPTQSVVHTNHFREFCASELRHVGNYTLGRIIGKGSFGKVYLARHTLTNGTKVVLKASSKDDPNLAREIHHHRQFIHPHIARLYEVVVTEKQVWLALEFCPGDELYHHLVTCGPQGLPVEKVQKIFTQLVGAVSYIHSKSCVHRDLKLENVLLDKNENVKLVDFGFTREYEGKSNYLSTFCGTVCYAAPEMLKGEKYAGEKVDVWSLGIVLYALLTGQLPFDEDDDQATKMKILKEEPNYPAGFPEQAKALVSKLLSKRPLYRPTLAEALNDPFLAEHAPAQQAVLKLTQPAPFTTTLEKATLERMKAAGVDIDKVIENVLSQRCDALAGWWALLIEKEGRKEARREKKRREKELELKLLRRLSGASSRFERIAPTLEDVAEENTRLDPPRPRSASRGRTNRRSTPQITIGDLPRLPEGSAIESPGTKTPPPPIEKDSRESNSGSRPPIPPKERQRRRSSNLQIMTTNPDLLGPPNGIRRHKLSRMGGQNQNRKFFAALKNWIVENTRRAASPMRPKKSNSASPATSQPTPKNGTNVSNINSLQGHSREVSGTSAGTRHSYGATLTPSASSYSAGSNGRPLAPGRLDMQRTRHRTSLSPSPITPRSSYRRSSQGLRGRKSTSSSVSSVRSIRYTHSKASSVSSDSHDTSTIHSPASRSVGRSPHQSLKSLPAAPGGSVFGGSGMRSRSSSAEDNGIDHIGSSVLFARRKRSPFKGPALHQASLNTNGTGFGPSGPGSPAIFARGREASPSHTNTGLLDVRPQRPRATQRKSMVIAEEEEEEPLEDDEEAVEEVDEFSPIDLGRGERVASIIFLDDPAIDLVTNEEDGKDPPSSSEPDMVHKEESSDSLPPNNPPTISNGVNANSNLDPLSIKQGQ